MKTYSVQSLAFVCLMNQFQNSKVRQARLLRRSLDEIKRQKFVTISQ
jgi:hypothetical protein